MSLCHDLTEKEYERDCRRIFRAYGNVLPGPRAVEAMLAAMKYRGPDGAGVWTEANVALGCSCSGTLLSPCMKNSRRSIGPAGLF